MPSPALLPNVCYHINHVPHFQIFHALYSHNPSSVVHPLLCVFLYVMSVCLHGSELVEARLQAANFLYT